jgi:hypothetical protein
MYSHVLRMYQNISAFIHNPKFDGKYRENAIDQVAYYTLSISETMF